MTGRDPAVTLGGERLGYHAAGGILAFAPKPPGARPSNEASTTFWLISVVSLTLVPLSADELFDKLVAANEEQTDVC